MTTYNTGNPLGSSDPRDLYDNAENLDELVNSKTKTNVPDRLGVPRKTWHSMESEFSAEQSARASEFNADQSVRALEFDSDQLAREQQYQQVILGYGNEPLGDYAEGIEVTGYNQIIRDCAGGTCVFYRAAVGTELPYTTTGLGMPEGGAFVDVGDAVLRHELANPDMGAAMVARGVVAVDSIADLLVLAEEQRKEGLRYLVKGYYAGSDVGGSEFYWEPTLSKSEHNGATVVDPDRISAWNGTQADLATFFQRSEAGTGCFVSLVQDVNLFHFGATAGDADSTLPFQQYADSMPEGSVLNQTGVLTIRHVTFSKGVTLNLYGCRILVSESAQDAIAFLDTCSHAFVNGGELEYTGPYYYGSGGGPEWWTTATKGAAKSGIHSKAERSVFDSVEAHGFSRIGLYIEEGLYGELRSCVCYDNGYAGAHVKAKTSVAVGGEYNHNGGGNGNNGYGLIANVYTTNLKNGKITIVGVTANGNRTRGIDTHNGWNVKTLGCHTEGNGLAHPRWGNLDAENGLGLRFNRRVENLTVVGNVSKGNTLTQIIVDSTSAYFPMDKMTITGNVCETRDANSYGIYIRAQQTRQCLISDNVISGDGRNILIDHVTQDYIESLSITGNVLNGSIYVNEEDSPYEEQRRDWLISNNICSAIYLYFMTDAIGGGTVSVKDNTVKGDGIRSFHMSGTYDELYLNDNTMRDRVQLANPARVYAESKGNRISHSFSGGLFHVVKGNVFLDVDSYVLISPLVGQEVEFVGNRFIGNTFATPIRFTDQATISVYDNVFVDADGAEVSGNFYWVTIGHLFNTGSAQLVVPDVQIDRRKKTYYIADSRINKESLVGHFPRGAKVINHVPSAGGYEAWVAVAAGSPATWKGVGLIEA